jgi:hypothetical protein
VASTTVMAFDGVLRAETDGSPIRAGLMQYHGAVGVGFVGLIVDSTSKSLTEHWLKINAIKDHTWLVFPEPGDPTDPIKLRQLQLTRLRRQGAAIDLVIETNPKIAAALQQSGIAVSLFMHPHYARPEFRADYDEGPRSWDDIMEEIDTIQLAK